MKKIIVIGLLMLLLTATTSIAFRPVICDDNYYWDKDLCKDWELQDEFDEIEQLILDLTEYDDTAIWEDQLRQDEQIEKLFKENKKVWKKFKRFLAYIHNNRHQINRLKDAVEGNREAIEALGFETHSEFMEVYSLIFQLNSRLDDLEIRVTELENKPDRKGTSMTAVKRWVNNEYDPTIKAYVDITKEELLWEIYMLRNGDIVWLAVLDMCRDTQIDQTYIDWSCKYHYNMWNFDENTKGDCICSQ